MWSSRYPLLEQLISYGGSDLSIARCIDSRVTERSSTWLAFGIMLLFLVRRRRVRLRQVLYNWASAASHCLQIAIFLNLAGQNCFPVHAYWCVSCICLCLLGREKRQWIGLLCWCLRLVARFSRLKLLVYVKHLIACDPTAALSLFSHKSHIRVCQQFAVDSRKNNQPTSIFCLMNAALRLGKKQ